MVAGVAGDTGRVLDGSDLWEIFRFSNVRFVTADTQHGDIKFGRLEGCWIVCVLNQRTVARFTVDANMFADLLLFKYVAVTTFARLVTRIVRKLSGDLHDGIPTVVSILAETLGHQIGA